jgi:chemotaxis protein CheX
LRANQAEKSGVNKDINESELRVFITAVTEYFHAIAGEPAQIRSAYLGEGLQVPQSYDYTGLITISGNYRGCVYFSCRQVLLRRLLVCMGENDHSENNLLDAVGEVANTISGNARKHFGATMEISVPVTIHGAADTIRAAVRARPFVITIDWLGQAAIVMVDLERLA